jgi:hypothetical protein
MLFINLRSVLLALTEPRTPVNLRFGRGEPTFEAALELVVRGARLWLDASGPIVAPSEYSGGAYYYAWNTLDAAEARETLVARSLWPSMLDEWRGLPTTYTRGYPPRERASPTLAEVVSIGALAPRLVAELASSERPTAAASRLVLRGASNPRRDGSLRSNGRALRAYYQGAVLHLEYGCPWSRGFATDALRDAIVSPRR